MTLIDKEAKSDDGSHRGIVHVVPALPPLVNGLGHYAALLAEDLAKFGVDSRLVVAGMPPADNVHFKVGDFQVDVVREQQAEALVEASEAAGTDTVLLHFVGYGYARRGLCYWLGEGLQQWKSRSRIGRLIIMFHELYTFGPPWRTSFWTSLPQRRIAEPRPELGHPRLQNRALLGQRLHPRRK